MKRAYIATQTLEYIVVAESEDAAKRLAVDALKDDCTLNRPECFGLSPMSYLPAIYEDETDLVYHDGDGDMTVAEAAKLPGGYEHGAEQPPVPVPGTKREER